MKFLLQLTYFIVVLAPLSASAAALTPLTISNETASHTLKVELAQTPQEQETGLMFRTSMPKDQGMLFVFESPRPVSMWMKNTKLPLDIIFIGADETIVTIAPDAVPMSLTPIPSGEPVIAVLELNGGTAKRLGLKTGDTVQHEALIKP